MTTISSVELSSNILMGITRSGSTGLDRGVSDAGNVDENGNEAFAAAQTGSNRVDSLVLKRERNRLHARATRQRKKFQIASLQLKARSLKLEQIRLKSIIKDRKCADILLGWSDKGDASKDNAVDLEALLGRNDADIPDGELIMKEAASQVSLFIELFSIARHSASGNLYASYPSPSSDPLIPNTLPEPKHDPKPNHRRTTPRTGPCSQSQDHPLHGSQGHRHVPKR